MPLQLTDTNSRARVSGLLGLVFLLLSSLLAPAVADTEGDSKVVDNVAIYLGLLPAEMIRGHDPQHAESTMHGGRPTRGGEYHVLITLFGAKSGARITYANIRARVSEIGMAGVEKTLQPMEIAGTETYGNYFPMIDKGPF